MIREMIDEAIFLFGDMSLKEILKTALPVVGFFILMTAVVILLIGIQPI